MPLFTAATLSMTLSRSGPDPDPVNVSLSKMLSDWGEGASNAGNPGGAGIQAQPGDATWLHTFYNTSFWTSPGGDFSATSSATTAVSVNGTTYLWSSTQLLADVQSWVSGPASNFGWAILGQRSRPGIGRAIPSAVKTARIHRGCRSLIRFPARPQHRHQSTYLALSPTARIRALTQCQM